MPGLFHISTQYRSVLESGQESSSNVGSFSTPECGLLELRQSLVRAESRMAFLAFIEGFWDSSRRDSALGYYSPAQMGRRHYAIY